MTDNSLTIYDPSNALAVAGQVANQYASQNIFAEYREQITPNTRRRQDAEIRLFEQYLRVAGAFVCELSTDADCWRGMTYGLVKGFRQWMLSQGYAVGSVNVRLATIKRYCGLAHEAGAIDESEHLKIKGVAGFAHRQARNVDEKREKTRTGSKKATATGLTKEQADALKRQPDTPQGRRDSLLMCLLLDHGLRCGEIAILQVANFDLKAGTFAFYRPKVDKPQTHKMTTDTLRAAAAYLHTDAPAVGALLLGSRKGGKLQGRMSERAINERVGRLGASAGIKGLSPHDCRHYWATRAARQGTDPFALQEAGGWNSLAMPRRYVETAKIANEGVKL